MAESSARAGDAPRQAGLFDDVLAPGSRPERFERKLIVDNFLRTSLDRTPPSASTIVIVPNRQAARSLKVPYISLRHLAYRIVRDNGLRVATELESQRLLRFAARRAGIVDDPSGTARAVQGTLRELLRSNVPAESLRSSAQPRMSRLGRVLAAYLEVLGEHGLIDDAQLLWRAAALSPDPQRVLVLGFPRIPVAEREFLDALAAPGSSIHLPSPLGHRAGEDPLFAENREAIADFVRRGWLVEESRGEARGPGERLAQALRAGGTGSGDPPPGEALVHAYPDLDEEVRGTLAAVKELLTSGVNPSGIAIVARQEESYGSALLAVAREYGVPVRLHYLVQLNRTRLGAWLDDFIEAVEQGFPFEVTSRLLASPLVRALDAATWQQARQSHPNGQQAWCEFVPALGGQWPAQARRSTYVQLLLTALADLGVTRNAGRSAREAAAFATLSRELRELRGGEREIGFTAFAAEVAELTSVLTVPFQPGGGGVALHTPLSLFGATVDHLFVVGAAEGMLPEPVRPDPLLDPFEREELSATGIPVESVATAARREELSFWALLHSVGTKLTISYPRLNGRRENLPSPFIGQLGLQVQVPPFRPACSLPELRRWQITLSAPTQAVAHDGDSQDPVLASARRSLEVEGRRESSEPGDEYDGRTGIPFHAPASGVGVSRLVALAECPFKFFAGTVLRLEEQEEAAQELEASLRGKLYHLVLQFVMERTRGEPDPRIAGLDALDEAFGDAEEELELTGLASWHLERESHLLTLRRALLAEDFIRQGNRVHELESEFRADWRGIPVRGRVDRIDKGEEGLDLVDYKSGGGVSNLAKDEGGRAKIDLQLSVYREAAAPVLAPGEPVARARYFSVTKAKDLPVGEASDGDLARIASLIGESWQQGDYPVDPDLAHNACLYCSFDSLCRKGPRIERKRRAA